MAAQKPEEDLLYRPHKAEEIQVLQDKLPQSVVVLAVRRVLLEEMVVLVEDQVGIVVEQVDLTHPEPGPPVKVIEADQGIM